MLTLNTINGLKAVNISDDEWTDNGDNTYTVVIPQTRHQQPASTKYILELQKQVTANSYQYIAFTPIVSDDGDITITTNEAIDCVLLIGSNLATDERGIMTVTNPTTQLEIDYNLYGALKVTQTASPTALTLLPPTDTSKFYAFFVTNDENSTETINWNGEDIAAGSGLQFRWDGASWIVGEQPTLTTEIYDIADDQLLSTTLASMKSSINNNASNITILQNGKADASALVDYVPTTRTVNGQQLDNDVNLSASEVGAYTTTETDTAISNAIAARDTVQTISATWASSPSVINTRLQIGSLTTENALVLATNPTLTRGKFYTIALRPNTFAAVSEVSLSGIYLADGNQTQQLTPFLGTDTTSTSASFATALLSKSNNVTTLSVLCNRDLSSTNTNWEVTITEY